MRGDDLDLGLGAIQKFPLSTGFFLGCLASGFCFFFGGVYFLGVWCLHILMKVLSEEVGCSTATMHEGHGHYGA
jgi:hypothetical protein